MFHLELKGNRDGHVTLASVLSWVSSLMVASPCLVPSTLGLQREISHKTGPAGLGLGLDRGPENRWHLSTEVIDETFVFICMTAPHVHMPARAHMY